MAKHEPLFLFIYKIYQADQFSKWSGGSDLSQTLAELHELLTIANNKLNSLSMIDDGKLKTIKL